MDTTAVHSAAGMPRKRFTPRVRLLTILGVGALVIAILRLAPLPFDNANRFLATEVTLLLIGVALVVWSLQFVFTTRRSRALVIGAIVVGGLAFFGTFRLEFGGDMQQRFLPRLWARQAGNKLGLTAPLVVREAQLARAVLKIEPSDDDSPTFFGPARDGVFQERHGKLARDWAAKPPREVWRKKIGEGCSSFVIAGKYGFTQEQTEDQAAELVTCYDLTDGKLEWVHADPPGHDWVLGGLGPRATPTFHQGKLYALGSAGLLNCFDAATGKVLWTHDVLKEHGAEPPMWGMSSSPLIVPTKTHGDILVVSAGGSDGKSLAAYALGDGREVWHAGSDPAGYATPQLLTLDGVAQVVIVNFQTVVGHDPETGAVLWRYDAWATTQPKVPQVVPVGDDRLFISAGYTVGCRMLEITRSNGARAAEPAQGNQDEKEAKKPDVPLHPPTTAIGDTKWNAKELWKNNTLKPKFMNPIARDGFVYGIDDGAFLMCISLADDGKVKWRSKRGADYGHGQLILVDDLLIVQSEAGDVALVPADSNKFEELGRFTALPEGRTWNVPVLWGKNLILRNNKEAVCYELPTE